MLAAGSAADCEDDPLADTGKLKRISPADLDDVLATALAEAREGDVIVTMSSGSFDGMPQRLLASLPC